MAEIIRFKPIDELRADQEVEIPQTIEQLHADAQQRISLALEGFSGGVVIGACSSALRERISLMSLPEARLYVDELIGRWTTVRGML